MNFLVSYLIGRAVARRAARPAPELSRDMRRLRLYLIVFVVGASAAHLYGAQWLSRVLG